MADEANFYRVRAEAEQANADAALLDNVRERCTRAAQAWDAMATRAERAQVMRDKRKAGPAAALDDDTDAGVDTGAPVMIG